MSQAKSRATSNKSLPLEATRKGSGSSSCDAAAVAPAASSARRLADNDSWSPVVLVKVGNIKYISGISWEDVKGMSSGFLLKALLKDDIFGPALKKMELSACTVHVLKGELPPEQEEPTAAEDADASKFVELKRAKTLADVAKEGDCKGGRLYIWVREQRPEGDGEAEHFVHAGVVSKLRSRLGKMATIEPLASPSRKPKHYSTVQAELSREIVEASSILREPISFKTTAAARSCARTLAAHALRVRKIERLFHEKQYHKAAIQHLPAFGERSPSNTGPASIPGLRAGMFNFSSACDPGLHVRGNFTERAAGPYVPGFNGAVTGASSTTTLQEAVHHSLMDLARIFFSPPPSSDHVVRFIKRPPTAFALLALPMVGFYIAVEWAGRVLVSAASATFMLGSEEHKEEAGNLPSLEFGEAREIDITTPGAAEEAWTTAEDDAAPTKFYRRVSEAPAGGAGAGRWRFQKLLFFDAYPALVWAHMARVYARLEEVHADSLEAPPPAVLLDAQLWYGAHVALVDMACVPDDAVPMEDRAFLADPEALKAVAEAVAWLASKGIIYTDIRGPNLLVRNTAGAGSASSSSSSAASGAGGSRSFYLIDYDDCLLVDQPVTTYEGFVEALRAWSKEIKERELDWDLSGSAARLMMTSSSASTGSSASRSAAHHPVVGGGNFGGGGSGTLDLRPLQGALIQAFAAFSGASDISGISQPSFSRSDMAAGSGDDTKRKGSRK